jgi:hypothetical protein
MMVTFVACMTALIGALLSWRFPWYREVDTDSHFGTIYPEEGGPYDKGILHRTLSATVGGILAFPVGYVLCKCLGIWNVILLYFMASAISSVTFFVLSGYFRKGIWPSGSGDSILALCIAIVFTQPYLWYISIRAWDVYIEVHAIDPLTRNFLFWVLFYIGTLIMFLAKSLINRKKYRSRPAS